MEKSWNCHILILIARNTKPAFLGLFKYEDKVTKFWPEFGQNGKLDVKICDILRHESGLPSFNKTIPSAKNAWTENLKDNTIGKFIEGQTQKFPTDTGFQI